MTPSATPGLTGPLPEKAAGKYVVDVAAAAAGLAREGLGVPEEWLQQAAGRLRGNCPTCGARAARASIADREMLVEALRKLADHFARFLKRDINQGLAAAAAGQPLDQAEVAGGGVQAAVEGPRAGNDEGEGGVFGMVHEITLKITIESGKPTFHFVMESPGFGCSSGFMSVPVPLAQPEGGKEGQAP